MDIRPTQRHWRPVDSPGDETSTEIKKLSAVECDSYEDMDIHLV